MVEQARRAALDGNWAGAIDLNREMIERLPRDAEAHNRLGRALLEFRRNGEAYDAYSGALRIDPANMIARRNLQRLELLRHRRDAEEGNGDEPHGRSIPRTSVFIEEVGKTWVDELVNPVPLEDLAGIRAGEQLQIEFDGTKLIVTTATGRRLGEVETKTTERVIRLIEGGNRYEVYALGLSAASLRVILREVFRDPGQATTVSFPRQISATRAYMRERDLLRQRDEADFLLFDEEDENEEDETVAEAGEDEEAAEPDADTFIEETVVVEEEEPTV